MDILISITIERDATVPENYIPEEKVPNLLVIERSLQQKPGQCTIMHRFKF